MEVWTELLYKSTCWTLDPSYVSGHPGFLWAIVGKPLDIEPHVPWPLCKAGRGDVRSAASSRTGSPLSAAARERRSQKRMYFDPKRPRKHKGPTQPDFWYPPYAGPWNRI